MRKVKCICIYKDNKIYNLTAQLKDTNVTLLHYVLGDERIIPIPHETFWDMYRSVLKVLKHNDLYCGYYEEFNKKWYDISFIDLDSPTDIRKFGI